MEKKYIDWRIKGIFNADAEKCFNEIQELGDHYEAEDVLERAKDPDSELHKCFLWDDTEAARRYRLRQARDVCASIVIKVVEVEAQPPKQFRLIQNTGKGDGYEPAKKIFTNPDKYSKLLERMKTDANIFINRYESLAEAAEIILEMKKVI